MSEQVSLDFLISLKQASQNVQQTRKVGGALDYLANLAKKANDALFQTSRGEDAQQKYTKGSKQVQRETSITAGLMTAAANTTKKALDLTIMGIRSSVGWWADHAGAMALFRKEMGYTSEQVHQFSMGVTRSAAQYGTSMRSVRDLTFFMARGAKLGQKEIGKLTDSMGTLSDFGGVDTATIKGFMTVMTGFNQLMDESDASHFALGIKALAQEYKVGADGIMKGFVGVDNLLPKLTKNTALAHSTLANMFASAESFREDPMIIAGVINQMGEAGTKMNDLFISTQGDLNKTLSIIMGQVNHLMKNYSDENGNLTAMGIRAMEKMGAHFNISQFKELKGVSLTYDDAIKNASKTQKIFSKTSKELRDQITANLTPLELVHQKVNQVIAAASGFWESFMGGEGGKLLMRALEEITDKINILAEIWGRSKDPSQGVKKLAQQSAVWDSWSAAGAADSAVKQVHGSTEQQMRMHTISAKTANDVRLWRQGKMSPGFVPPMMAVQDARPADIERLKSQASTAEGRERKALIALLQQLVEKTDTANKQREKTLPGPGLNQRSGAGTSAGNRLKE